MKTFKKTLSLALVLVTILSSLCLLAVCSSSATKTLKNDTYATVTAKDYYKITVTGEGYITVSAVASASDKYGSSYAAFKILNSKKKEFCKTDNYFYVSSSDSNKTKGSVIIPVSKGTYYVSVSSVNIYKSASVKLKYKFTSVKQPTNYCAAKAISVAAGKTQKIYQTPLQHFDRWYKITLKKNQKITLTSTGYRGFTLYDAEGEDVELSYDYNTEKTTSKNTLAKGTYYLIVSSYTYHAMESAYATFSWK